MIWFSNLVFFIYCVTPSDKNLQVCDNIVSTIMIHIHSYRALKINRGYPLSPARVLSVGSDKLCKIFSSLCYKTFYHEVWCEKKDETLRPLRCETCGGMIKGVRTPSPNGMIDDDELTVISTPTEMELAMEVIGDQVSFTT